MSKVEWRDDVHTRYGSPRSTRILALAATLSVATLTAGWLGQVTASAQEERQAASEATSQTWRELTDRPVIAFIRGPAGLLLTEAEVVEFTRLVDRIARLKFMERLWFDIATNCPVGDNPVRDQFWQRAEEAEELYGGGMPGWLTDRGRTFMLLGPPDSDVEVEATIDGRVRKALVWKYDADGGPRDVAFIDDSFGWKIVGHDMLSSDGDAVAISSDQIVSLNEATQVFARRFRSRGCELTPEQLAEQEQLAWRRTLWDSTGALLAGETVDVKARVDPQWYFFQARDGATFTMLTVPLDQELAEGERVVAMLRGAEGDDVAFLFGSDEVPFEVRPAGAAVIAQAARALPPGRYSVALGILDEDGQVALRYAGQQIIARVTGEDLRLTSIVLARELKALSGESEPGAFRVGGFEVVPKPGRDFRAGEDLNILFEVVGATSSEQGAADLTTSYQLYGKPPGRDWVKIGAPNTSSEPGAVRVWSLSISPQFRPAEYKVEVQVVDNATGARVSKEIPFRVVAQ